MRRPVLRPVLARPVLAALALAACADSPVAPPAQSSLLGDAPTDSRSQGRGDFHRYVAIGTSVSQGWASDGVLAESQRTSWPAQLARLAHRELPLPLIAAPGCGSPVVAPLAAGVRLSGEGAAAPFPSSRVCAPNEAGVTLSTGNVAISGARTIHALAATPEQPDPNYAPLYARVLEPGMSQVTSMEARNPKIVSVELGVNEVLGIRNGGFYPAPVVVPVAEWAPQYREVVARVDAVAKRAVLVGLIDRAANLPSFRTGAELWAARATFAPLHVTVSENCSAAPGSDNMLFVPVRVPLAAGEGAARRRTGAPPAVLSCANLPATGPTGAPILDYVVSPADLALADAQLAQMNQIIQAEAAARGFAYFALSALYEQTVVKAPFNAVALLTTPQPYGPYISLDGVHPSAEGSRVLAEAAARALNATYRMSIPTTSAPLLAQR